MREVDEGPRRVELMTELGRVGLEADLPAAVRQLETALELAADPAQLTASAVALARGLRHRGQGAESVAMLQRTIARLDPPVSELITKLEVEVLAGRALSAKARLQLSDWVSARLVEPDGLPQTDWEHLTLATMALDAALGGEPVTRVQELADRATAGFDLARDARLRGQTTLMAGLSYMLADRFQRAGPVFEASVEGTRQRVLAGTHSGALANRASLHLRCGRLPAALADAQRAAELGADVQGARTLLPLRTGDGAELRGSEAGRRDAASALASLGRCPPLWPTW
ncbi:MAG: hypothetical protein ACR2NR_00850 [Solirubrobacteraceae bacterium]